VLPDGGGGFVMLAKARPEMLRHLHDDVAQHPHLLHYPLTSVARALRHSFPE
jgi:hypothetical protein